MARIWYFAAALTGMCMYSVGMVMQKKGMDKLNLKNLKNIKANRDFYVWLIGILLAYVISVLPTGIASGGLSPQIVSAISGLSIVMIIILSHFFLGDQIFRSDIFFSIIIILSIFGISIYGDNTSNSSMDEKALYLLIIVPFVILLPFASKKIGNQLKTILLATFSGLTSGLSYVLLNIAVKQSQGSFAAFFSTIYYYEYMIVGFFSGFSMQLAYRYGKIINIAPIQVSLSVIFPLVCSYFIFSKSLSLTQNVLILVIAICCWAILKKH